MQKKNPTFGQRLTHHREAMQPRMSQRRALNAVARLVPDRYAPGESTLSRMESDLVPEENADGILIVALAGVYGCRVSDLSPLVAAELESIRDLLEHASACTGV